MEEKVLKSILEDESKYTVYENKLIELGVASNLLGFLYLVQGCLILDKERFCPVTKVVYPEIAKINHTTASRVERAMRHAVEVCWNRGNIELLNDIFGYTVSVTKGKPTNSEFMSMLVLRIQQEERK